jgi:hypothetical protein
MSRERELRTIFLFTPHFLLFAMLRNLYDTLGSFGAYTLAM